MQAPKSLNLAQFSERLVGLELENQVLNPEGEPITFSRMQAVWEDFVPLGWSIKTEPHSGVLEGVKKIFDGGTVVLTSDCSAGNIEMTLPPLPDLHQAELLLRRVQDDIVTVLANHSLRLIALGLHPGTIADPDQLRVKSTLYRALAEQGASDHFCNGVNLPTSANQTGVSIRLGEAAETASAMIAISGLIVALCANSPISHWTILPWKEWRLMAWEYRFLGNQPGFDRLSGFPLQPFQSYADYLRYYWNTPFMIFPPIREEGWVITKDKLSFTNYLASAEPLVAKDLSERPLYIVPTVDDINLASISMWPFAKLHIFIDPERATVREFLHSYENNQLEDYLEGRIANSYLECRAGASTPVGEELTIPALSLGLVNNTPALTEFVSQYRWRVWKGLHYSAAKFGLETTVNGQSIIPLVSALVDIAQAGLEQRQSSEAVYLQPLRERITNRQNPADIALSRFKESRERFVDYISYPDKK